MGVATQRGTRTVLPARAGARATADTTYIYAYFVNTKHVKGSGSGSLSCWLERLLTSACVMWTE